MKRTDFTSTIAKVMMVGLLAGAVVLAAPTKAKAQGFSFGVQVGYPHYDYSRRDFYEHQRFEEQRRFEAHRRAEFERREAIRRHEEWERARRFHDRGFYGRDGQR